ncbi:MAG: response regulator transcription factor [Desulfobacterales bacterium]|uniref:Response regulator transcription factor n=1 Tax=Candidatus Desulfatibia vada TaxID=2841696 RepID=A0A8J6TVT1_9BACT|nr:response regulator transcription factor [Candidatus Desulfatibia vada]MBL6971001.1 response regulator transcription factor [Desulfobacterales bacterium]
MSDELDVIIVDDDPSVCEVLTDMIKKFYTWGNVISFTDVDEAISYCLSLEVGVGIFVIDVFLGGQSGFCFLDSIKDKFPAAHEDSVVITGSASDDVVNMCISSDVHYLLEKPIRPYALQLAVRAIVTKYLTFARRLLRDPSFAANVTKF